MKYSIWLKDIILKFPKDYKKTTVSSTSFPYMFLLNDFDI